MKVTREMVASVSLEADGSYWNNIRRLWSANGSYCPVTSVGYGPADDRSFLFYFILKQKLLPPQAQIHTINIRIADIK
jgi:hypothetical protein